MYCRRCTKKAVCMVSSGPYNENREATKSAPMCQPCADYIAQKFMDEILEGEYHYCCSAI